MPSFLLWYADSNSSCFFTLLTYRPSSVGLPAGFLLRAPARLCISITDSLVVDALTGWLCLRRLTYKKFLLIGRRHWSYTLVHSTNKRVYSRTRLERDTVPIYDATKNLLIIFYLWRRYVSYHMKQMLHSTHSLHYSRSIIPSTLGRVVLRLLPVPSGV